MIGFDLNSQESVNLSGIWKWIDLKSCNNMNAAYDPWSCNFISLTNCTRPEAGVSLINQSFYDVYQYTKYKNHNISNEEDFIRFNSLKIYHKKYIHRKLLYL